MKNLFSDVLNINFDGMWTAHEIIMMGLVIAAGLAVLLIAMFLIKKLIGDVRPRKDTIFRHRRNQYKDSTRKKHNF